jgi:tetratricopeptide (TPR) repeat protein
MAMVALQSMYDDARRLLEAGDVERVLGIAEHMLAHYPEYLEAYRIVGESELANHRIEAAVAAFTRVLRSDPEHIPAHAGLGVAYTRLGRPADAIAEFETALEIKPDLPELRSQLLRLYTDTYGSEHAQLRLSRAGLARLYVKGHMLPQAIQEFRAVAKEKPGRFDAQVALAETLWRDGQQDAAVEECGRILQDAPDMLKPNLMLGYVLLASGDEAGHKFWNKAVALDPHMGVAQTLFGTLPPGTEQTPMLPEWDEQAWRQAQHDRLTQATETTPDDEAVPAAVVAGDVAAQSQDDLFSGSWLANIEAAPPVPERGAPPPPVSREDDDFLATLLASGAANTSEPPADTSARGAAIYDVPDEPTDVGAVTPFSLDDLDQATASAPAVVPFSLDDLDADPAPLDEQPTAQQPPEATPLLEPQASESDIVTPFSLDDLDLGEAQATDGEQTASQPRLASQAPTARTTPDEQFNLDDLVPAAATDPLSDEPELRPFSLADLGLSDDEIATLDGLSGTPTEEQAQRQATDNAAGVPPELRPFSLDELELDMGLTPSPSEGDALPQSLQPFSLDDPLLDQTQGQPLRDAPTELPPLNADDDEPTPGTFSWQEPTSRLGTSFIKPTPQPEPEPESSIFSKLLQRRQHTPPDDMAVPDAPPVRDEELDMSLFSMDDVSLRDDAETASERPAADTASQPGLLASAGAALAAGASAVGDALSAGATAASNMLSSKEEQANDATQVQDATATPTQQPITDEPALTPFSLADLGLTEEEIATLGLAAESASASQPVDQSSSETNDPPASLEQLAPQTPTGDASGEDEPELRPFSLAELGLSDEEIAALGLDATGTDETASDDPGGMSFSKEELEAFDFGGLSDTAASATQASAPTPSEPALDQTAQPAADPFDLSSLDSLSELDTTLADDVVDAQAFDLSGLDSLNELSATPTPGEEATPPTEDAADAEYLKPFSLSELGLSDEEIATLGLGVDDAQPTKDNQQAVGGLDSFDLVAPADASASSTAPLDAVDQLLALGRQQGFVDINDIIAVVDDPVAEADRIEEIGQMLHHAGVEIRDGDEVIDMEEEYSDELEAEGELLDYGSTNLDTGEPDLRPFSLSELGLSDEEIAALGLDAAEEQGATTKADADVAAAEATPTAPDATEPELRPFSLSELGLSDDEIAALGPLTIESETTTPPSTSDTIVQPDAADPDTSATQQDEDLLLGLDSLSALDTAADEIPPVAPVSPQPAERASALTPEEKASLADKKDLVSNLLADLRNKPERPKQAASETPSQDVASSETFETLVPSIDEPPATPTPAATPALGDEPMPVALGEVELQAGNAVLDEYLKQLKINPDDYATRLAVARLASQVGRRDVALEQYKQLIKRSMLLNEVVDDLMELVSDNDETPYLQRLHRTLGDAYSKQGRFREAINEYSWTLTRA